MARPKKPVKIGIDFGNMFTVFAAILSAGAATFLKDISGAVSIASLIYLLAKDEIYWGFAAQNAEKSDPGRVLRFIKIALEDSSPDGSAPALLTIDGHSVTAYQAAVLYLRALKLEFERQLGRIAAYCVISVPANYSDTARRLTKQAGLEAGFEKVKLVSESSAAAVAYGLENEASGTILVVDVGGGTTDVTVMRVENGNFIELATAGEKRLGGNDLDNLIIDRIEEEHERLAGRRLDIRADLRLMASVRDHVITAKHALSVLTQTQLCLSLEGTQIAFTLTREQLDERMQPLLDKLEAIVLEAVTKAGLTMEQIDHLVLVGGTSKVPAIRERVERVAQRQSRQDIDPETAVALGDALLAQIVNYDEQGVQIINTEPTDDEVELKLREKVKQLTLVSPHALGVEALVGGSHPLAGQLIMSAVYPENTPLGQTLSKVYKPERAFQTHVNIKILEGKPDAPSAQCKVLGEFDLPIAVRDRIEPSIQVNFSYSLDGLVKITVTDKISGSSSEHELQIA